MDLTSMISIFSFDKITRWSSNEFRNRVTRKFTAEEWSEKLVLGRGRTDDSPLARRVDHLIYRGPEDQLFKPFHTT